MVNEPNHIDGERTASQPNRPNPQQTVLRRGLVVMTIVIFLCILLWTTLGRRPDVASTQPQTRVRQTQTFEPAREPPPPPTVLAEAHVQPVTPAAAPPAVEENNKMLDAAQRAPVMAFNKSLASSSRSPELVQPGLTLPAQPEQRDPTDDRLLLDRKLQPTRLEGSRAGLLGNRNMVLTMGTSIPCILETALSSDQPGFVTCSIQRDALSDNGRVVLMAKGTQVVGEYRSGTRRGQDRLFVLWTRAKTPEGVIVNLNSPASDALGRAGFDGWVDTHWWERFGSALLLSIVSDGASNLSRQAQDSQLQINGIAQAGQQAAAIAVERSIDIPPTLNKNHGDLVSIFVARDLDFSDVYRLRVIETRTQIYDRAVTNDFSPAPSLVTKP